jgi:hypothetical protein
MNNPIYSARLQRSGSAMLVVVFLLLTGCRKQLLIDPPLYTITEANVFQTESTAAAALTGILQFLSASNLWKISPFTAMSADELHLYNLANTNFLYYYQNALKGNEENFWSGLYQTIYYANAAIAGVEGSDKLSPAVKDQLLGEAKFERAFSYFYLVNLFGDVPLILGTDYQVNRKVKKDPAAAVYDQIRQDLVDAEGLLSADFLDATVLTTTTERVRPTKWAAAALLARVYLYVKDYALAEAEASKVIGSGHFQLSPLEDVFKMNSTETIWQLQPVNYQQNTNEARFFVISSTGFTNEGVYMNERLLNSFENGDLRKTSWVGTVTLNGKTYAYPYKYKVTAVYQPSTEYVMMLRLGEQYLIRAEARIRQNRISDGIDDLTVVRNRATDPSAAPADQLPQLNTALSPDAAVTAVIHERQVELFTEWGHRWLDLKRTGIVDSVMGIVTPEKGKPWNTNWQLYPIPIPEIIADPNLAQNKDY